MKRRQAVQLTAGSIAWLATGCQEELDLGLQPGDDFDEVLDRLHTTSPVFNDGLSNHGPMAAEALVAMGLADRVVPFIGSYDGRLERMQPSDPLPESEQEAARGDDTRRSAWIAAFDAALTDLGPREVLRREWETLAPAMVTSAFHPALRVAHAVRSFERRPTASRLTELAHGLGYWSADYERLDGEPGGEPEAGFDVARALKTLPILPRAQQIHEGLISARLGPAVEDPDFRAHVARVDFDALPYDEALTELCAAAARALTSHPDSIALLHAVTGPSSLRLLWDWLDDEGKRLGLVHAFHGAAALICAQADDPPSDAVEPPTIEIEGIVEQSSGSADEHAIKLREACIREFEIDPRPEFLRAAQSWPA